jgi:hypothetical protein
MPSSTAEKKLDIITTVKEGFSIGIGSMIPIFVNVLLWVLTIWIPYLNVGTTIGLCVGIVSKAGRGEAIFRLTMRTEEGSNLLEPGHVCEILGTASCPTTPPVSGSSPSPPAILKTAWKSARGSF